MNIEGNTMDNKPNPNDLFFKKPSVYEQKVGELDIIVDIREVDNLSATCVAMDRVAKAQECNDLIRNTGRNDYTLSLKELFNAFDTFVREKYSDEKYTAGMKKIYHLSKPHHLTIFLLWQFRCIWTHHGGVIDNKCEKIYEKTIVDADKKGIEPNIPLPISIPIGFEFSIDFDNYLKVKQCVFEYIGEKIPKEDLEILKIRSSISNLKFEDIKAHLHLGQGHYLIDLKKALDCGCSVDITSGRFSMPSEGIYDETKKRIILKSSGESFYAEKRK